MPRLRAAGAGAAEPDASGEGEGRREPYASPSAEAI